ncbi:MAG: SusC/RagA family TonB-linked outer membrane protein [Salinibacter sp.]
MAQTGTVKGTVVKAETGAPLPGVNVVVQGTTIGSATNPDGAYTIEDVPAGTQTISAQFVGYQAQTQEVEISAGETVTVNFEMRKQSLGLEQVVVTGTGGEVKRKAIGHTVAEVEVAGVETAGVGSITDALVGKKAGVSINMGSGSLEQNPRIRIRGSASLAISNEPLVYVDGIRVNSGGGFAPGVGAGGLAQPSALSQLNFDAIKRVEILKGPSAATLYGSQANAGVIQIFTKQGSQNMDPQFSVEITNKFHQMPNRYKPIAGFVETEEEQQRVQNILGVNVGLYEPFTSPVQLIDMYDLGLGQDISASVRGGGNSATYYSNVRYSFTDGPFNPSASLFNGGKIGDANDTDREFFWTGNLSLVPSTSFRTSIQAEYSRTNRETYGQGISIFTPTSTARYAKPERVGIASEHETFGIPFFATPREGTYPQISNSANRGRVTVQASYLPIESVTADAQVGIDYISQRSEDYTPFGHSVDGVAPNPSGELTVSERNELTWTVESKVNWDRDFGENFTSSAVTGFQYYRTQTQSSISSGTGFSGPGLRTVDATGLQTAGSAFKEVVNAGVFAQEQVGYREAAYLTVGVRLDASSAFGENFNYATYPKVSFSFLPTQFFEEFSIPSVSQLRLRGAWGQSGQQPGAFDRFTTFVPVNSPEGSGVRTDNLGNEDLKPETATEWETGFDLGLFENRLSLTATYWYRRTEDALIPRNYPPSGGFRTPQLTNAGTLLGQGLEFSLNGDILQTENFSVSGFANAAYLWQHVESLGGSPPIKVDPFYVRDRQFIKEGYAPGAFFGTRLPAGVAFPLDLEQNGTPTSQSALRSYFSQPRNPTEFVPFVMVAGPNGNALPGGQTYKDHYKGKQQPDWDGSAGITVNYRNFTVSTRFTYAFGNYYHHNLTGGFRRSNSGIGRNIMKSARLESILKNPESTTQERMQAAKKWVTEMLSLTPYDGLHEIEKADYLRWSNLSISYSLPQSFVSGFGVNSASLTARGGNLALWTKYDGVSPLATGEANTGGVNSVGNNFEGGMDTYGTPQLRTFSITFNMKF